MGILRRGGPPIFYRREKYKERSSKNEELRAKFSRSNTPPGDGEFSKLLYFFERERSKKVVAKELGEAFWTENGVIPTRGPRATVPGRRVGGMDKPIPNG